MFFAPASGQKQQAGIRRRRSMGELRYQGNHDPHHSLGLDAPLQSSFGLDAGVYSSSAEAPVNTVEPDDDAPHRGMLAGEGLLSEGRDTLCEPQLGVKQEQPSPVVHPMVVRPVAIRPVPLKAAAVARPAKGAATAPAAATIPQEDAVRFYDSAYDQGLTADEMHQAILFSHEWHRKWTHQVETGHGFYEQDEEAIAGVPAALEVMRDVIASASAGGKANDSVLLKGPSSSQPSSPPPLAPPFSGPPVVDWGDRFARAKNPSPEDTSFDNAGEPRKRIRSVLRERELLSQDGGQARELSLGPLRPRALRIPRPSATMMLGGGGDPALLLQHAVVSGAAPQGLPQDISEDMLLYRENHRREKGGGVIRQSPRAISPLTIASLSSGGSVGEGSKHGSGAHVIEPGDALSVKSGSSSHGSILLRPSPLQSIRMAIREARDGLLEAVASSGGHLTSDDSSSAQFHSCLQVLERQQVFASEEGMWLSLTAPNYFGNLGENDGGDPRYTLGRMAFDMFSPTRLVCSLQGNFNSVERVSDEQRSAMLLHVPKALQDEVMANTSVLRTYNIVSAFTIEPPSAEFPDAPNRDVHAPIRGIMTTYGYTLPDPHVPNRLSIWITGGRIEPNGSPADVENWKRQFDLHPSVRTLGEKAKLLAVKMLMGAHVHEPELDGSMEYTFTRPVGGHGIAYVDTLYCDRSLRIVRGHRGTVFVFTRVPDVVDEGAAASVAVPPAAQ